MNKRSHLVLPYCPYCGAYKGVGTCNAKDCLGNNPSNLVFREVSCGSTLNDDRKCQICGEEGITRCSICNRLYCREHSKGNERQALESKDQRMGTCTGCGKRICENCWILDSSGRIMCLQHLEGQSSERF